MSDDGNPIVPQQQSTENVAPATSPAPAPAAQTVQPTDPNSLFADQLQSIKTEDGRQKYADVQTALASVPHAQDHIAEQASRIKELEEQVAQQKGMDAVLEQLQSQQNTTEIPSNAGLDETTIAQLLDQRLDQRDVQAKQDANANSVLDTLKKTYGEKAETQFTEKASSLGVSVGFLSDMARSAPQAVLAYFTEASTSSANPTVGSINTNVLDIQTAAPDNTHMDIFTGGSSSTVGKWRAAAATT